MDAQITQLMGDTTFKFQNNKYYFQSQVFTEGEFKKYLEKDMILYFKTVIPDTAGFIRKLKYTCLEVQKKQQAAEELEEQKRIDQLQQIERKGPYGITYSEDYTEENTLLFIADEEAQEVGNKYILEKETFRVLQKNPKSFLETISKIKQPGCSLSPLDLYLENRIKGKIIYKPYDNIKKKHCKMLTDETGRQCIELNIYPLPAFIKQMDFKAEYKIPSLIRKLINHLLPSPRERAIFLDKLHHVVRKRCQTYIILSGAKGTGKTSLVRILIAVLGNRNARFAPTKFITTPFNGILKYNRLLILDEVEANTSDKMDYLKEIINDEITINVKFVNSRETITNYNSFILLNNDHDRIAVKHDDRRFYFFNVTDDPMSEAFTEEEILKIINFSESSDEIIQFGRYLYNRTPKIDLDSFYVEKTERFLLAVHSALSAWQKLLVDILWHKRTPTMTHALFAKHLAKSNKRYIMPSIKTISTFLNNYRHGKAGVKIGKIIPMETAAGTEYEFVSLRKPLKKEKENKNIEEKI